MHTIQKRLLKDVFKQNLFLLVALLFTTDSVFAQVPDSTKRRVNFSLSSGLDLSGLYGEGFDGATSKFRFLVSHPIGHFFKFSYGVDFHAYRYNLPIYKINPGYYTTPGSYTQYIAGYSHNKDYYIGIPLLLSFEPSTKKWSFPAMFGLMPAFNWRAISDGTYPKIVKTIDKGEVWAMFTTASFGYLRNREHFDLGLSFTTNFNLVTNKQLTKRQFSVGLQCVTRFHLNKPKRSTKKSD